MVIIFRTLVAVLGKFVTTPPLKTLHAQKISGKLIFGSLHKFHVIHSASRNYTWKAGILCVIHGVGHYIEKIGRGTSFTVSLYIVVSLPLHKIIFGKLYMSGN